MFVVRPYLHNTLCLFPNSVSVLLHLVDVYHGHCWTPAHLRLPISRGALVYVHVYLTLHYCIFSVCSFTIMFTCMIHTTKRAIFCCRLWTGWLEDDGCFWTLGWLGEGGSSLRGDFTHCQPTAPASHVSVSYQLIMFTF